MSSAEPTWPGESFQASREEWARAIFSLLADERKWVHRRVERIEFVERGLIRRAMSVDFTLPSGLVPLTPTKNLVPLALFRKETLRGFSVRDQDGTALPVLTRLENSALGASLLKQVASAALDRAGISDLPDDVEADLEAIAGWSKAADERAAFDAIRRFLDEKAPSRRERETLFDDQTTSAFMRELSDQFILIAEVPVGIEQRRIIKIENEHPWPRLREEGAWRGARSMFFWVFESVGVRAMSVEAPTPSIVDTASYHVEVIAPEGVFIAVARLSVELAGDDDDVLAEERAVERSHLYSLDVPDNVTWSWVDVNFSLRPGGLVLVSAVSTCLTAGILWLGVALDRHGVTANEEPTTALIVLLPSLFAAYLLPREHPLARRMFSGLRIVVFISSLLGFGAAGAFALDLEPGQTPDIWFALAIAASVLATVTLLSLVMSWARLKLLPWLLR